MLVLYWVKTQVLRSQVWERKKCNLLSSRGISCLPVRAEQGLLIYMRDRLSHHSRWVISWKLVTQSIESIWVIRILSHQDTESSSMIWVILNVSHTIYNQSIRHQNVCNYLYLTQTHYKNNYWHFSNHFRNYSNISLNPNSNRAPWNQWNLWASGTGIYMGRNARIYQTIHAGMCHLLKSQKEEL